MPACTQDDESLTKMQWIAFPMLAAKCIQPSDDSFISEYFARALSFLYLNLEKKWVKFTYSMLPNIVWFNM